MKFQSVIDSLRFTLRFFSEPRFTGSVLPSSRFLGKAMAKCANLKNDCIAIELGSGTGPITRQILATGFPAKNLWCVEFDKKMCDILTRNFLGINIINDSAEKLTKLFMDKEIPICAVISSLPLLSLPSDVVKKVLEESESVLDHGGRFVQFTYKMNRNPDAIKFKNMRHGGVKKVYMNFPPARVDWFEKL